MTTDEPVSRYMDSRNKYALASNDVVKLGERIKEAGEHLSGNPHRMIVSNIKGGGPGFPGEVAMDPSAFRLNASLWPTAEQIADTLKALWDAHKESRQEWAAIPKQHRLDLPPPPKLR